MSRILRGKWFRIANPIIIVALLFTLLPVCGISGSTRSDVDVEVNNPYQEEELIGEPLLGMSKISFVGESSTAPVVFTDTDNYIRLDFTMFAVEFYKGTAGYNKIFDKLGNVLVYDDRMILEYLQGKQWKQRGTSYDLTWEKISESHYEVTRYYSDYLSTNYTVTYFVRTDTPMKASITLHSGQTNTYRIAWYISGIQKIQQTLGTNQIIFGDQDKQYDWVVFDWGDIYQRFGDITTSLVETKAAGMKASIYFAVGDVYAGQSITLDPSYIGSSSSASNNPLSGSFSLPFGWQAGDVAVFWWYTYTDTKTITFVGTGLGITQKRQVSSVGYGRIYIGWRVLQFGDSTFNWTSNSIANSSTIWGSVVFRGVDNTGADPFEAESGAPVTFTDAVNPNPPAVTVLAVGAEILPIFGKRNDYTSIVAPTNYTSAGSNSTTTGSDASAGVAYRDALAPGVEDPPAWTLGGGAASDDGYVWTGVLRKDPWYISCASGNWTASTTWALVDATSLLDSEVGTTEVLTAPAWGRSSSFTPGAITIDGIAIKMNTRAPVPAGTVSVRLYDVTGAAAVAGTNVTLNVSDLPTCDGSNNEGGWVLFKFAPPVLLLGGGNLYAVEAQETVATDNVYLWRNGTASNWSRMLRTTTNGIPAIADVLHVIGEHTGIGAGNSFTVVMDSINATTDYGSGTDGTVALTVGKRGTLDYAFAAATNYYLKLSGNAIIYNGGTFTIGTVGSEIPRDSTAVLEFDPVADGGMGLIARNGATVTMQGLSRTVGKNFVSCKLNTDEAIGQTELGVDTDTGWLAGDEIGIASTTRTYQQCESRTIAAGGADVDHIDVTAGLTYAHSGIAPTQAEVILLTRNVKVRSATSTIMTYFNVKATSIVDIDWVEFYYLGENAAYKRGILIETTTGSFNMQYSSVHDTEDYAIYTSSSLVNNFIISNNVLYNVSTVQTFCGAIFISAATTGTNWTINNNIVMLVPASPGYGIYLFDVGGTWTNNTVVGASYYGIYAYEPSGIIGNADGNIAHSCGNCGFYLGSVISSSITGLTAWRCNSYGLLLDAVKNITFTTVTLFGNLTYNISISTSGKVTFVGLVANGDSTFSTTNGLYISNVGADVLLESCDMGTAGGIKTAHTNDINIPAGAYCQITLINTILASGVEVLGMSGAVPGSYVKSQKHDQQVGSHKTWKTYGIVSIDSSENWTAPPSQRLTPNNATNKLESGSKYAALANGTNATFSVYVKESAAYNGNPANLVLKKNVAAGINSDTVLDTVGGGVGAWEQLIGTTSIVTDNATLEVVVDCDGTVGYVNVDDWSDPPECVNPNGGETYWFAGLPHTGIKKQAEEGETYWSSGLPSLHLYPTGGVPDITNAPNSYDYNIVQTSTNYTTGLDYFTITNNSGFAVDITIGGTDMAGGISWTLSDDGNPGADIVGLVAGLDGDSYNVTVKKNAPYNPLKLGLGAGLTQKWGLQICVPTSFSDGVEKSGTVTITAVAS